MATGNIKRYTIVVTLVGILVFPITWIAFALGMPPESCYVAFIIVYIAVLFTRVYIMKGLIGCPVMLFIKKVIFKIIPVAVFSSIIPVLFVHYISPSFLRLIETCIICTICSFISIWIFGISKSERMAVFDIIKKKLHISTNAN